ncbi:hypothetical protein MB901379_04392 [Mycobacterium basiliense]|uniref:Uncharacterized protein n=1 Tax=Mycobacterium basiliense TaxID=2094119 RepID=A0A3S5D036_9MYCO|nr:hypothetical protein MB901379_04392 [Mycobacterium basiliense]
MEPGVRAVRVEPAATELCCSAAQEAGALAAPAGSVAPAAPVPTAI